MIARLALASALLAGCTRDRAAPVPATGGEPAAAVPAPVAAVPTILFIGTSLTAGLGVEPGEAYPAVIQRKIDSAGLGWHVVNAGVSGETSAGALRRIDWVLRQPAAIVVLETGANDGLRGQDPDSIRQNIQAIIERVRARDSSTQVVLVGMNAMPNLGRGYVRGFEAIYPALARENHLVLIPSLLAGVGGVDSLNQPDGIHPTPRGHMIMANTVWRALLPLLARGTA